MTASPQDSTPWLKAIEPGAALVTRLLPSAKLLLLVGDSELSAGGVGTAGTHGFGVAEAVELTRALGRLPSRLVLIGVEAGTLEAGRPLSPAVSARLNDAVQAALAAARVTAEPSPSS